MSDKGVLNGLESCKSVDERVFTISFSPWNAMTGAYKGEKALFKPIDPSGTSLGRVCRRLGNLRTEGFATPESRKAKED